MTTTIRNRPVASFATGFLALAALATPAAVAGPEGCDIELGPGMLFGDAIAARSLPLAQTFSPTYDGEIAELVHGLDASGGLTAFNFYICACTADGRPPADYATNHLWAGYDLTAFSDGTQPINGRIILEEENFITVEAGACYAMVIEPASSGLMTWLGTSDGAQGGWKFENGSWDEPGTGPVAHTCQIIGCATPVADLEGECPGGITMNVTNATPNGSVAMLFGLTTGSAVIPDGMMCGGATLGLGYPGLQLVATSAVDGVGRASIGGNAPSSACGAWLQILDLDTCQPSNLQRLD